ncbi:AAA family ATPase [Streptomyces sp. NBC_00513]|uniref:AAA family ATPase n=1 Tax=unclassified Streptomyces TaxID=2593676 RepID=UPI00224DEE18|nr:AAA family ATPase [Streptomyces sp. NBC_00424]MCX5072677.1 AAA family ATPase [Streptomyces sp. NBC_00424]WUD44006.1 AAA family ATPase [Streptomyces sp. NBC_00513]
MELLQLRLPDYSGLRNFTLDLEDAVDKGQAIAVLIGPNGGGKSRVLHALAELFGALHRCALGHSGRSDFGYEVRYQLRDTTVEIVQPSAEADPVMWVTDAAGSRDVTPRHDWLRHLPDHVFGYQVHGRVPWGSEFERHVHFAEAELAAWREQWTESWFAWQDRPENEDGVWAEQLELPIACPLYTPGFLCTPDWLPLVLLSLATQWADVFGDHLREQARVDGVVSAVLHLRAPASVGEELSALPYWGLGGPPRALFAEAAASGRFGPVPDSDPLYSAGTPDDGFALTMSSADDVLALRNLFDSDLSMFGLLSTLQMAGYLTVDVRVCKADGSVVGADQLSSGEQQILTVLGLLRLQRGQESLFLLDEPDAHFHPEWSRRWYSSVQRMLGDGQRSQFIAATHEPLLVSNMLRQQIRVLGTGADGQTTVLTPDTNPRGRGAGGLLTSDLFHLRSQLDEHTQDLIDTQYHLIPVAEDDPAARQKLQEVTDRLDGLGFATRHRDPVLSSFLAELHRRRTELIERARSGDAMSEEIETTARFLFDERFTRGV